MIDFTVFICEKILFLLEKPTNARTLKKQNKKKRKKNVCENRDKTFTTRNIKKHFCKVKKKKNERAMNGRIQRDIIFTDYPTMITLALEIFYGIYE